MPVNKSRARVGVGPVLYGMLGGPIAWALHLMLSYFLVALGCELGWQSGATASIVIATLVFAGAAVAACTYCYRRWRSLRERVSWDAVFDSHGRSELLWISGFLLGGLFTIAILLAGSAVLFTPNCSAGVTL